MCERRFGLVLHAVATAFMLTAGCEWLFSEYGPCSLQTEPPELNLHVTEGDTKPIHATVRIVSAGAETVSWTACSDRPWLGVSPTSGSVGPAAGSTVDPATGTTVRIAADPTGMSAGLHAATVTVEDVTGIAQQASLAVNLHVAPPQGTLAFAPARLDFQAVEGDTVPVEASATLAFTGTGTVTLTAVCDEPWLAARPADCVLRSGAATPLLVSVDPTGLAVGRHTGRVKASDGRGFVGEAILTVILDVIPSGPEGTLSFTPTQLSFRAVEGDTAVQEDTATLGFAGSGTVSWTVASDQAWLAAGPASGTVEESAPSQVTISADPTGLAVGQYTAHVTASDAAGVVGDAVLTVILYVKPPPQVVLQAEPRLARLHALSGDAAPAETVVTLSLSGGTNVGWEATPADAWLQVLPAAGALSDGEQAHVALSVDPGSFTIGLHVTTLTFSAPDAEAEDVKVTVSFALRSKTGGTSGLVHYVSRIDDTRQPYGIYLPAGLAPGVGSPVAVHMHGYGGHASSSFSSTKTSRADAAGMILVDLEGRGQHQHDGAAETDLFEVLADVDAAYGIDRSRVFLEGCSMGGTGSFRFIARHPDVFAGAGGVDGWTDYRLWHEEWYAPASPDNWWVHPAHYGNLEQASPLTHAENVLPERLFMRVDMKDIPVYSEGDPKLHARLDRLETAHDYAENADGFHCSSYSPNVANIYDFFVSREPLDLDPSSVRVRSNRLRTAEHAWFRVERFAWNGWAEVAATRTVNAGTCTYELTTRNVRRFAIASPPPGDTVSRYVVKADGVTCLDEAAGAVSFPLTIELALDETGSVISGGVHVPPASPVLEKRPALEGPVMRALCERFVVAYGSAHAESWVNDRNRAEARKFCDYWAHVWSDGYYGFGAIWDRTALSGTLCFSEGDTTVTGSGTKFLTEVGTDDLVKLASSSCWFRVAGVTSDTELELAGGFFKPYPTAPTSGAGQVASTIAPVDEADLAPADLASANLVIFGSEESSALLAEMAESPDVPFRLPVRILEDQITLAGDVFPVPDHGIWMVYPNPLAPGRLVVVGHHVIGSGTPEGEYDMIFWTHDSWAWKWPEFVIFDTSKGVRDEVTAGERYTPDQFVKWGFFDQDWALAGPGDPRTEVTVATDQTAYAYGTTAAEVTVAVEDETTAPVAGFGSGAFEVRIDGELRPAAFVETATPGVYEADVTIADLIVAGYDLTVEVVRPDAGGPIRGIGRTRFAVQ